MQRIKLGKPYEEFIQNLIESGYYGTATEVIRDALRDKMERIENDRIANIRALIAEGEEDIRKGRTIIFDENYITRVDELAKKKVERGDPIPKHIRP